MTVKKKATAVVAVAASTLVVAAPSFAADQVRTDLSPGDVVSDVGVSLVVPERGQFTWATAELERDGAQSLGALTQEDGTVVLADVGRDGGALVGGDAPLEGLLGHSADPDPGPTAAAIAPKPCDDGAYSRMTWTFSDGSRKHPKWKSTYNWYFRASTTPTNVAVENARAALVRAVTNITGSHTDCPDLPDEVTATSAHRGDTTTGTNISTDGTKCMPRDNKSVVAFGTLASGTLAVACTSGYYYTGDTYATITDADVRINKAVYSWYGIKPSDCSTRWGIEATMTHEFGHAFGLGHVTEAEHGNLTMSTHINGPCQNSESSLGLGDVRALRLVY